MTERKADFPVVIDEARMRLLADTMGQLKLAEDFSAQLTPMTGADDETALRAYLWAAAICHSTKGGLSGYFSGRYFKGWDFLLRAFVGQAALAPGSLDPAVMARCSARDLDVLLSAHSTRTEMSLADLPRRAEILRETAAELSSQFDGSVLRLLRQADNAVGGTEGAYALLERLPAFRDVLQKKSSAFLMTVHFSGLWHIEDDENILPMIDYHRMRVLMRTGCIVVQDAETNRRLRNRERVEPIVEAVIRKASMRVCAMLPKIADMPMFDFDVLLWAHARSCCRNAPVCTSGKMENDSFTSYLSIPSMDRCVFEAWCPGAVDARVRDFWEPIVATEDY
ncbi:hypothetical protein ACFWYW_57625 [Nonomuraea sp. NPDC059023]|uniref:hypothetical protein n=1 Tax=unclassified Nonomuraea TaxID=2593643 RepID=UPI003677DED4